MVKSRILLIGSNVQPYHRFDDMAMGLLSILGNTGLDVTASTNPDLFLPKSIKSFDCILSFLTESNLTPEQEEGLVNAISGTQSYAFKKPKGFVGLHGATTGHLQNEKYIKMLGARFQSHPEMCEFPVNVKNTGQEILSGIEDFTVRDELYLQEFYPPFDILMSTNWKGVEVPLAWTKPFGTGRVCYFGLGHGEEQLRNRAISNFIINAVKWSIGNR